MASNEGFFITEDPGIEIHLQKRRFSFLKLTPYCLGMTLVVMVVVSVVVLVYCATRYKNTYHIVNATGSFGMRAGQGRAIIGGKSAMPGQYPYVVSIRIHKFGQHNCGGSIVTKNWILSASHCFRIVQNPRRIYVLAGTVTLEEGGEVRRVDEIVRWDKDVYSPADIIMLKVKKSFTFDDIIQPVKLPFQDEEITIGTRVHIMGWGHTETVGGHGSKELQFAELELYLTDECDAFFNIAENYSMRLCAGSRHGDRDSCVGDSGGPMVLDGKQIGIVSYGSQVCGTEEGRLAVYTKVAYFSNWIRSVAGYDE